MENNKKSLGHFLSEYAAYIALIVLAVVLCAVSPEFRTASNFLNLMRQATFNGLIAFGMTCVILSDGIDLSVGSTFALSAIICAEMLVNGISAPLAIVTGLVVGTVLGAVSGIMITKGRLQPFIATLITMTAYRGFAMIVTDGKPISKLKGSIESEFGAKLFETLGKGSIPLGPVDFPVPVIIMLLSLAIFWFILHKTTFGRKIYATGSNIKCANLVGVDTTKTKIIVYAISGFMAALAGLIMISRVDSAQSILGEGYELDAIAAVALGGTSMSGGRGKIMGTFAGVLIIAVLNNGMNIMGINTYYQSVVKALVILIVVLADRKR
ncbi:MAG: ribose ABC transporter permease [Anaerotignum sp.]|nr:ribose ABC transporter permease [Anaerotignum sp.]